MLGKLFKHEMKACSRLLLPLFLVLAVTTIMDRIVLYLDIFKGTLEIIPVLITFVYVISIIATVIVSIVIIILRFYKNLLTDEGYLMFTLPVKSSQLINAKMYSSIIWIIASLAAITASIFAVATTDERFKMLQDGLKIMSADLDKNFGNYKVLLIIEIILCVIIALFHTVLTLYASISLGQLLQSHKIIGSIVAYIAVTTIMQIAFVIITATVDVFTHDINDLLVIPQTILPIFILFFLIFTVAFYCITNFIFKRKVNLD